MSPHVLIIVSATVFLGVAVPWVAMRMIVPSLRSSQNASATNYAGRRVFYGLGTVWLVWAGCAVIAGEITSSTVPGSELGILTPAGLLALVAFALGLVDDAYGSSSDRGFKGHLKAMLKGRLTTGGMKLVGIGMASLVAAIIVAQVAPWGGSRLLEGQFSPVAVGSVLLAGASIALTSNLFNLFDLRPGRALKLYAFLVPIAVASAAGVVVMGPGGAWLQTRGALESVIDALGLLLFLVGPLVAVWRYDLGEEAMLGDAGANPMGAVIGLLIVAGLPLWGLVAWTLLVFGLNLASERVSFSAVIEGNALLRSVDAWGRLAGDAAPRKPVEHADGPLLEESKEIKSGN